MNKSTPTNQLILVFFLCFFLFHSLSLSLSAFSPCRWKRKKFSYSIPLFNCIAWVVLFNCTSSNSLTRSLSLSLEVNESGVEEGKLKVESWLLKSRWSVYVCMSIWFPWVILCNVYYNAADEGRRKVKAVKQIRTHRSSRSDRVTKWILCRQSANWSFFPLGSGSTFAWSLHRPRHPHRHCHPHRRRWLPLIPLAHW